MESVFVAKTIANNLPIVVVRFDSEMSNCISKSVN